MIKRKLVKRLFTIATISCAPILLNGATLNVSLSNLTYVDLPNTTGVWNSALGTLHPTLKITGWVDGSGTPGSDINIDVGDGSDGPFNTTTYSQFGTVTGNVIAINTDVKQELNVTTFHLDDGWIIRPTGSRPLIIRSLSDVIIDDATIDCSGASGSAVVQDNGSSTVSAPSGGSGRCGGGRGGNGGRNFGGGAGTAGTASSAVNSGGGAGDTANSANGGGGGGGGGGYYNQSVGSGETSGGNATGSQAPAGTVYNTDPSFQSSLFGGGGGGGGGSYIDSPLDNKEATGGGGGGGGGVVIIHAARNVTLTHHGSYINASGGTGATAGNDTVWPGGTGLGGGGGGGGGGTIWIAAANQVDDTAATLPSTDFGIFASQGTGGTGANGRDGGTGSYGRSWVADTDTAAPLCGTCSQTEYPGTYMNDYGRVRYNTGAFTFITKSFDLSNTKPQINSLTLQESGTGTATAEISASDDNFVNDNSGWISSTGNLSLVSGKRYVKVKVSINNTSTTTPKQVTAISLDYTVTNTTSFDFVSACGRFGSPWEFLFLFSLLLGIHFWLKPHQQKLPT